MAKAATARVAAAPAMHAHPAVENIDIARIFEEIPDLLESRARINSVCARTAPPRGPLKHSVSPQRLWRKKDVSTSCRASAATWRARSARFSEFDPSRIVSNTFTLEWPPRSGRQQAFPEIDRAAWFPLDVARVKILKGQVGFLDQLKRTLKDKET